jgi:hypothetical protein
VTRSLARKLLIAASFLFALGPLAALATVDAHARPGSRSGANFICLSVDQVNFGLCLQPPIKG